MSKQAERLRSHSGSIGVFGSRNYSFVSILKEDYLHRKRPKPKSQVPTL